MRPSPSPSEDDAPLEYAEQGSWRIVRPSRRGGRADWPRVGILHSFYRSANPSGENAAVLAQFRMLADHGVDVTLIGVESDDVTKTPLTKVGTAVRVSLGSGHAPPREAGIQDLDVLHVHNTFPNISHRWLEAIDVPIIATVHNYRAFCAVGTFVRRGSRCTLCVEKSPWEAARQHCYRDSVAASTPIAIQQSGRHSWRRFLGSLPQVLVPGRPMKNVLERLGMRNLFELPQPVDPVSPMEVPGDAHARPWLFVGRLSAEKGIVELLRSWPKGETLVVAGSGELSDAVDDVVRSRGLQVTCTGDLRHSEVMRLMSGSRGLIFPSRALEGAPLVYAEAMSAGVPVLAAEGNVLAEQVVMDSTGVVFDLESPESLAGALVVAEEQRATLSAACMAAYEERYTRAEWLRGVHGRYIELLASE